MDNEMIVKAIRAGKGDVKELLGVLYKQNRGFIYKLACKYQRGSLEIDDLMQEAYFALLRSVETYDENKGKFITWLSSQLQGAFMRCGDDDSTMMRLPVYRRDQVRKYRKEVNRFYQLNGKAPTDHEMCMILGLSIEALEDLKSIVKNENAYSLDAPLQSALENGDSLLLMDLIPDETNDIEKSVDQMTAEEIGAALWKEVEQLPDIEGRIIKEYYCEGRSMRDIGKETGEAFRLIVQKRNKALKRLRKCKNAERLRSFLEVYSAGLTGTGLTAFRYTGTSSTEREALYLIGV